MGIAPEELTDMEIARRAALANAVQHGGTANHNAVLGKIFSERPDLKSRIGEIHGLIDAALEEVNIMTPSQQKAELEKMGGAYEQKRPEERKGLPELENTGRGVVVRFAPNPDGAIHLGNARPAVLSHAYARKYGGKFILRFEDTDPKIKTPERQFYGWIREDVKWLLGEKPNQELEPQSTRLPMFYEAAKEAIEREGAYVCTCDGEEWKKLRVSGQACPCRSLDVTENMKRWKAMLGGKYSEGKAVLRIKTSMEYENPAVRDWAAFRIVDKPNHPLNRKAHVWPLYNFAAAVDDHLSGTTHILRGQEHATNTVKQKFLYDIMGWDYPETIVLGRFSLAEMVMSKSLIRKGIAEKRFSGWDDPKLGTIRALQRRGFQAEALRNLIIETGPTPSDSIIATENLEAYNRKVIDPKANRYFFIAQPVMIKLDTLPAKTAQLKLHPERKPVRHRTIKAGKNLLIERLDFEKNAEQEVRLMGLCNIKLGKGKACKVSGNEIKPHIPKMQWLPDGDTINVTVVMPNKTVKGVGEKNLLKTKVGEVIQFERFGFVRIDEIKKGSIIAWFAHK